MLHQPNIVELFDAASAPIFERSNKQEDYHNTRNYKLIFKNLFKALPVEISFVDQPDHKNYQNTCYISLFDVLTHNFYILKEFTSDSKKENNVRIYNSAPNTKWSDLHWYSNIPSYQDFLVNSDELQDRTIIIQKNIRSIPQRIEVEIKFKKGGTFSAEGFNIEDAFIHAYVKMKKYYLV